MHKYFSLDSFPGGKNSEKTSKNSEQYEVQNSAEYLKAFIHHLEDKIQLEETTLNQKIQQLKSLTLSKEEEEDVKKEMDTLKKDIDDFKLVLPKLYEDLEKIEYEKFQRSTMPKKSSAEKGEEDSQVPVEPDDKKQYYPSMPETKYTQEQKTISPKASGQKVKPKEKNIATPHGNILPKQVQKSTPPKITSLPKKEEPRSNRNETHGGSMEGKFNKFLSTNNDPNQSTACFRTADKFSTACNGPDLHGTPTHTFSKFTPETRFTPENLQKLVKKYNLPEGTVYRMQGREIHDPSSLNSAAGNHWVTQADHPGTRFGDQIGVGNARDVEARNGNFDKRYITEIYAAKNTQKPAGKKNEKVAIKPQAKKGKKEVLAKKPVQSGKKVEKIGTKPPVKNVKKTEVIAKKPAPKKSTHMRNV